MAVALYLLALALAGTFLGRLTWIARSRRRHFWSRRGFVSVHPEGRAWLRNLRLAEAEDFLGLEALIVSGHPGRQVGRLTLGEGPDARVVYLKREMHVRWRTRMTNFLAGFGWVSRCVREAGLLEALERDGLPGPHWLATGEDSQGRGFLLVEAVPGSEPLSAVLARPMEPARKRQLAIRLGETLGRLHEAGFFHRDLYAKHVLVRADGTVVLLDWQRAWRGAWIPHTSRIRDLAALHATVAESLACPRDRLAFLLAYLGKKGGSAAQRRLLRQFQTEVEALAHKMRQHRHIREKRQPPTAEPQAWICLDGDSICITPALAEMTEGQPLDWLSLEGDPPDPAPVSRRWLVLPGRRQVLLMRRRERVSVTDLLRCWLLGRPMLSPEQRRATLLWRLERHGVPAPRVLAAGRKAGRAGRQDSLLLCEPCPQTVDLSAWLEQTEDEARRRMLRELGEMLGRMHEACCYLGKRPLDGLAVHLGIHGPQLVFADVEGITPGRRPLPARAASDLHRIEACLEEKGCGPEDWEQVRRGYADLDVPAYPPPVTPPGERMLSHTERAEAPHTAPFWQRLTRGWRRLRQRPDWAMFAGPGWPDRIMQVEVTDRFHAKQGRSTGRWRLLAPDGSGRVLSVYLKRHYELSIFHGLLSLIWPSGNWSPAMAEYEHLEWARQQGVPVPATVAAGEFIGPWGKLRSFLAVEELANMLPLNEAIPLASERLAPEEFRRWKRGLVAEMARLARLLHDRRHFHKDLYLCHFYILESDTHGLPEGDGGGWRNRVSLIDLHRLTHHPWAWSIWQLKDLAQLLYSSEVKGIDARDQLAFWMNYRGPGAQRWSSRWLRRLVVFKWRRYARHNQRRKQRLKEDGHEGPV